MNWDFVDSARIDWRPGETKKTSITVREGLPSDALSLRTLLRVSPKQMTKWYRYNQYTIRLAVRNFRHPAGIVIARHTPTQNEIVKYWLSDTFATTVFFEKLLIAAALEQPELPTEFEVPKTDHRVEKIMERLGWPMVAIDEETNTYRSRPWEMYPIEQPKETEQ